MTNLNRRYDIDWLRVIAIGLLVVYHISIGFQPWGVFIGFIQNSEALEGLWTPMSMLNVWRIPLLFFVSGMGVCFAMGKRNWKQLMIERTRRILVPLFFGIVGIVPLHILLWQKYYMQDLSYSLHPGHLWFLGNIFLYVLILSPLFFYLKRNENSRFPSWIKKLFRNPLSFLLIIVLFIGEILAINPESFELYAMTWHGFFLGLLAFLFGFSGVYSGDVFWQNLRNWRWIFFAIALGLYLVRLFIFDLKSPYYLTSIESCSWIFSLLGFANRYLNRPSRALTYLSRGAYPIYILHMVFLYLASYFIFPISFSPLLKLLLVIVVTLAGCFGVYEFIIRRITIIRPLFGVKGAS